MFNSAFSAPRCQRFNMHQHVADGGNVFADFILHVMGDFMRVEHRHLRVHFHVACPRNIDNPPANDAFFHAVHAGRGGRNPRIWSITSVRERCP